MKSKFLPFEILHEDRDILVIDKPIGLLTTHTRLLGRAAREEQPTVENFLNQYVRKGQIKSTKRVCLVHRLDRETSGVMLFVKDARLAEMFRENWNALTEKTYLACVVGTFDEASGVFESYLRDDPKTMKVASVRNPKDGKLARTEWRRLSEADGTTRVEVTLKSGRKNQIRVHFSEAGHPVVGDVKYGGPKARRLYLQAQRLAFVHPVTHKRFVFESQQIMPVSERRAIVALGSNVEPRLECLQKARAALLKFPGTRLEGESAVRETEPVDVPAAYAGLKFLNQVIVLRTTLSADDFSRRMHAVEDDLGRIRTVRNGPRTIDLDLIDFAGEVRRDPDLTLPHPRYHERDFVLEPLRELGLLEDGTNRLRPDSILR